MPQQDITFATPSSSNIAKVDFDGETDTMTVTFRSGDLYDYMNVPASVVRQFAGAGSAGQFFDRQIKNRYPYEKR